MLTEKQVKLLEELGFSYRHDKIISFYVKGYGKYKGNGDLIVYENGGFNICCSSCVYEEIVADLAKLKEGGIE